MAPDTPDWARMAPDTHIGPEWPQEAQIGPKWPQEPEIGPEWPREVQIGPAWPQEPQIGPEWSQEPQIGPEWSQAAQIGPAAKLISGDGSKLSSKTGSILFSNLGLQSAQHAFSNAEKNLHPKVCTLSQARSVGRAFICASLLFYVLTRTSHSPLASHCMFLKNSSNANGIVFATIRTFAVISTGPQSRHKEMLPVRKPSTSKQDSGLHPGATNL